MIGLAEVASLTRPWRPLNLLPRVKSCRRKVRELGIFDDERFFSHVKRHKVLAKLGGATMVGYTGLGIFFVNDRIDRCFDSKSNTGSLLHWNKHPLLHSGSFMADKNLRSNFGI